jgi:hypothetical protein
MSRNHAGINQRAHIMKKEINAIPARLTANGRKAITSATASPDKS